MAEVDTSSYPKPAAFPTQKSLLDQVQQYQAMEINKNTIDKQKLDLVNQRFSAISKGFVALASNPNVTKNDVSTYLNNQVQLGYMPQEMAATTLGQIPDNATPAQIKQKLETDLTHAQSVTEAINFHYGQNQDINDNATLRQGVRASPAKGGGFTPSTEVSVQLHPGTSLSNTQRTLPNGEPNPDYLAPGIVAPSGPSGVRPAGGLRSAVAPAPTAPAAPITPPAPLPQGEITNPAIRGQSSNFGGTVLAASVEPPATLTQRIDAAYPRTIATGAAPGTAEAIGSVASQSGKEYANALSRTKSYQSDIYPAQRVIDILKEEGPQAFGVGTDNLNTLKNAIVTWFPNVDPKTIQNVANFEEAKKQLVALSRSSGNTGTNDQLAAAFEANPNTRMTGATIENVLKSVVSLRKMEQAQTLLAQEQNVAADQYSKWIAKNQNVLDPRAFGFDMMNSNAQQKLLKQLEKDPAKLKKFKYSLEFADKAGLIGPE